ncbi:MAG: hypothetical protein LBM60_03835 [Clostridium sp.]|jgi:ABC-2 type transport system permease protein|nr:hypothetical protein [Clostridium sp.]
MWAVIRRDLKSVLRSPLIYVGTILIGVFLYFTLSKYFTLCYVPQDMVFQELSYREIIELDADVAQGYIPASYTQNGSYQVGMRRLANELQGYLSLSAEETKLRMQELDGMSVDEIDSYIEKKYGLLDTKLKFVPKPDDLCLGTPDEINAYLDQSLQEERYTEYFGRVYCDLLGLMVCFFGIVFLVPFFWEDSRKSIYEILHTKPIGAAKYIMGKVAGGVLSLSLVIGVLTVLFGSAATYYGALAGFPVSWWDCWVAVFLYIMPNVIYMVSMYVGIVMIFKSPIAAFPILTIQLFYSHLGGIDALAPGGYRVPALAMLIRFPERFFETSVSSQAVMNQALLLIASVIFITISMMIWSRRRTS